MTDDRLFHKYRVERRDNRDKPGGDKEGARYFVLDYVNDPHARTALAAYAESIHREAPEFAADIRRKLTESGDGSTP